MEEAESLAEFLGLAPIAPPVVSASEAAPPSQPPPLPSQLPPLNPPPSPYMEVYSSSLTHSPSPMVPQHSGDEGGAAGTEGGLQLRFLVQNLWCHYAPHCSSPNKKERLAAFKELLGNYDVLLLQEIFLGHGIGKEAHRDLLHHAASQGLCYAAIPRLPMIGQNSGLLALSRWQISRQAERDWGHIKEIFPTKKGILQVDLALSPSFALTAFT